MRDDDEDKHKVVMTADLGARANDGEQEVFRSGSGGGCGGKDAGKGEERGRGESRLREQW